MKRPRCLEEDEDSESLKEIGIINIIKIHLPNKIHDADCTS